MKNKKLVVFNIVILLLFIMVVMIGKQTWGISTLAVTEEKVLTETAEKSQMKENPLLAVPSFVKKNKSDLSVLLEEPEVIELEEEEMEEEPDIEEPHWVTESDRTDAQDNHTVTQTRSYVPAQTSKSQSPPAAADTETNKQKEETGKEEGNKKQEENKKEDPPAKESEEEKEPEPDDEPKPNDEEEKEEPADEE